MRWLAFVFVASAMLLAVLPVRAADEIHVLILKKDGCGTDQEFTYNANADFTISNITNCVEQINIWAPDQVYSIGRVTLSGSATQRVNVVIGSGAFTGDNDDKNEACINWKGLTVTDSGLRDAIHLEGGIDGNLTDTVIVGQVYRFDVTGSIAAAGGPPLAGFEATVGDTGQFFIEAGSVGSTGFLLTPGSMFRVETAANCYGIINADTGGIADVVVGGSLRGEVIAATSIVTVSVTGSIGHTGAVTTIRATAGTIGTVSATGDIGVSTDTSKVVIQANPSTDVTGINTVSGANVYAEINASLTPGKGRFRRLDATGASGDFKGKLTCTSLTGTDGGVYLADDYDARIDASAGIAANITIGGDFIGAGSGRKIASTKLNAGYTISIRGKFTDGAGGEPAEIIFTDSGGLDGQVIINANNGAYMTWTTPWTGDVIVDGSTVTPGAYPDTDLGDGAIGLARFHVHKEACIPYDGQTLSANAIPNNRVDLVHYGPVQRSTEGALCVKVERKPNGGVWSNVSSQFEPDNGGTGGRVISVKPKVGYSWQSASEYKITHNSPQGETVAPYIQCVDVTNQPGAKTYTYHFFTN